jgi:predicted dithiol-disulfide oxidoreductase (DUF899 family)
MTTHTTASRAQWLAARLELLEAEKELTRRSDDVARQRQQLPWVPVENDYRFETEAGFNGFAVHLEHHDVGMIAVSRAPLVAPQAYKRRMGWTFQWASSLDSDFSFDFNTAFTEDQQRSGTVDYNYRPTDTTWLREAGEEGRAAEHAAMTGTDAATYLREQPGMSAFAVEDGAVYHTYSAYARGLDALWGMYQWLDRAPKGRNDAGAWFRPRDQYQ